MNLQFNLNVQGQTAKPHGLGSKGSLLFDELFPTWRFVSFTEIQLPEIFEVFEFMVP